MQESTILKQKLAGKEGEVAAKHKQADTERMKVEAEIVTENLQALAAIHKAEDPKGVQTAIPEQAMEGAITEQLEELMAITREGFREFHGRLQALESEKQPPPAA
jgi:glycerate-2-kinase